MAGTRRRSWSPTLSSSVGNLREDLSGARLELADPVPDRPQQHPLRTGLGVRRACRSVGFDPSVGLRTDDYVAIQALVAAGLGVSIMPSLGVGPAAFPTHACAVAAPTPTRRISIALARDGYRPPSVDTMIEILKDAAARHTAVA